MSIHMLWPMLVVIASNTIYNICAKQTPGEANTFFSLGITYCVAMISSFVLFFVTTGERSPSLQLSRLNWTSFVLGLAIIGLEFGYVNIYRAGWKVSVASLVSNIGLAIILLIVGVLAYKEVLSVKQVLGIVACGVGLVLLGGG